MGDDSRLEQHMERSSSAREFFLDRCAEWELRTSDPTLEAPDSEAAGPRKSHLVIPVMRAVEGRLFIPGCWCRGGGRLKQDWDWGGVGLMGLEARFGEL